MRLLLQSGPYPKPTFESLKSTKGSDSVAFAHSVGFVCAPFKLLGVRNLIWAAQFFEISTCFEGFGAESGVTGWRVVLMVAFRSRNMITSHVLHNPCQHCLLLALPAASLRPRIATFLTPSNDLKRFSLPLGSENTTACTESPVVAVSGFHSGSRSQNSGVYARQGNRVSSPGNFFSRFSVTVRASMEVVAAADVKDSKSEEEVQKVDPIVQYIVLRKDLVDTMKWPLGSVISQGCHAAVAAVWLFKDDPVTAEYCSSKNLDHMHKVTLEVKGETQLSNLAKKLEAGGVAHKLWTEQPENYATCLATKPYHKSEVASFFKSLKLCR